MQLRLAVQVGVVDNKEVTPQQCQDPLSKSVGNCNCLWFLVHRLEKSQNPSALLGNVGSPKTVLDKSGSTW